MFQELLIRLVLGCVFAVLLISILPTRNAAKIRETACTCYLFRIWGCGVLFFEAVETPNAPTIEAVAITGSQWSFRDHGMNDVALIWTTYSSPAFSFPPGPMKKAWTPQSPITSGVSVLWAYRYAMPGLSLAHCITVVWNVWWCSSGVCNWPKTDFDSSYATLSSGLCHLNTISVRPGLWFRLLPRRFDHRVHRFLPVWCYGISSSDCGPPGVSLRHYNTCHCHDNQTCQRNLGY